WPVHNRATQLTLDKQQIKHVIIIMQENRSFDNYFGAFPLPQATAPYSPPTGISMPQGETFPWDFSGGMGVSSNGTDQAPNYRATDRQSPCSSTIWNPQLLTAAD